MFSWSFICYESTFFMDAFIKITEHIHSKGMHHSEDMLWGGGTNLIKIEYHDITKILTTGEDNEKEGIIYSKSYKAVSLYAKWYGQMHFYGTVNPPYICQYDAIMIILTHFSCSEKGIIRFVIITICIL